jgi:hypothetical protein
MSGCADLGLPKIFRAGAVPDTQYFVGLNGAVVARK